MSAGARNIHAMAAVLQRLRREALEGQCKIHPDRSAIGFIEHWTGIPGGVCEECAAFGEAHGYTIHRDQEVGS